MAILGDMGELGDCSWKAHQAIADLLVESGLRACGWWGRSSRRRVILSRTFDNVEQVKKALKSRNPKGIIY